MQYESNPKHTEPWQRGKKGSLCNKDMRSLAQQLLDTSELIDDKRYAFHEGKAYCAQEHRYDRWHGYPVGWKEVPPTLVRKWTKADLVKNQDIRHYWESHE